MPHYLVLSAAGLGGTRKKYTCGDETIPSAPGFMDTPP